MIDLLFATQILIIIAFIGLLRFIFSPYLTWKQQIKNRSDIRNTVVYTSTKKFTFEEYKNQIQSGNKYYFSMIIPAYNEENRIAQMLKEHLKYFQNYSEFKGKSYEVIVVNDCSKDKTSDVVKQFFTFEGKTIDLKIVEYPKNIGKGGAVRTGMLIARGEYTLFADADGATDILCFDKLKSIQRDNLGIAVGSRAHLDEESKADRKFYRKVLALIANFIVQTVCGVKLKDSQCGFKLFTEKTTQMLFTVQHLERWAFDVEILMIANHFKIPIAEVPVNWQEVDGSHLNVVEASITMARDYLMVRLLYLFRIWKYSDSIKIKVD